MIEKLLETQIIDGYSYKNIDLILLKLGQKATEKEILHIPKGLLEDKSVTKFLVEMGMLCILGNSKQVVLSNSKHFNMVFFNDDDISFFSKNPIFEKVLSSTVIVNFADYMSLSVSRLKEIEIFENYHEPKILEERFKNKSFVRINDLTGFLKCKKEFFTLIIKNPDDSKELMETLSLKKIFDLQKFVSYEIWEGLFDIHQRFNPKEHSQSNLNQMEELNIDNGFQLSSMVNYYFKRPTENLLRKINEEINSSEIHTRLIILNCIFRNCSQNNDLSVISGYEEFAKSQEVTQEVDTINFKISAAALTKTATLGRFTIPSVAKKIQEMVNYGKGLDSEILESMCCSTSSNSGDIYIIANNLNIPEQKYHIKMFIDFIVENIESIKNLNEDLTMKLFHEKYLDEIIPKKSQNKKVMKF